jgi:hypothetical protein
LYYRDDEPEKEQNPETKQKSESESNLTPAEPEQKPELDPDPTPEPISDNHVPDKTPQTEMARCRPSIPKKQRPVARIVVKY